MPLEDHYSGDRAFRNLASVEDKALDKRFAAWSGHDELVDLCQGDQLMARLVFHHTLEHALQYMKRPVPALDGLTPVQCLGFPDGVRRFKECLLRFPD